MRNILCTKSIRFVVFSVLSIYTYRRYSDLYLNFNRNYDR